MKKLLIAIDQSNTSHLFWAIVAAAILIAARMQAIQHGWINPDSVFYLEAAKLIVAGDFKGAYQIFKWPFYAICIGVVSKLTTFNVHLSAQLLNMMFFGIATASFLKIIQLSGGKNLALFAGGLLLFSNLYIVGDVLEMLMRDEGFWAFYLTSLVFFIRYYQLHKISDAIMWQICAIIAVLFRIEAITYLLLLPLIFTFDCQLNIKQRLTRLLHTYSIVLTALTIIFISIVTIDSISIKSFGRLQEVFSMNIWSVFTQNLMQKSTIMSEQVLGKYLEEYAVVGLLLTFTYVIIIKNITTLGLINLVLLGAHVKNKLNQINSDVKRVLLATCIISLINMSLIITKVFVLSSRYVVAFTFILLVGSALYLGHLFKKFTLRKKRGITIVIWFVIIISGLSLFKNLLTKESGYHYTQDAIEWVNNNFVSNHIFYEDSKMRYYAEAPFIGTGMYDLSTINNTNNTNKHFDLLVLNFGKHDQEKRKMIQQLLPEYKEIKRFYARKHKKYCAIYQKKM